MVGMACSWRAIRTRGVYSFLWAMPSRRQGQTIRGTMVVAAIPGGRTGVLVATKNKGGRAAKKPAAKSLKEKRAAKKAKRG